jgi:hypothetical protein
MSVLNAIYNQILHDPEATISQIDQFLGGNLNTEQMLQVVDRNLYRERRPG